MESRRADSVWRVRQLQAAEGSAGEGATDLDTGSGTTPLRVWRALIDHNYSEANRLFDISPRQDFQDVDFTFYYPKEWYRALIARTQGTGSFR